MIVREVQVKYGSTKIKMDARKKFGNSKDIFDAFRDDMFAFPVEVFRVIYLDAKNRVIVMEDISRGSLSTSVVHPREVYWSAVHHRASAIVCIHSHPSGDPAPSQEDRECTNRLHEAGKILGIRLLDHIIIGESTYFSFADASFL